MEDRLIAAYRRNRKADRFETARQSLALARRTTHVSPHDWHESGDKMTADLGRVDVFDITATVKDLAYEPADIDFYGEFTDEVSDETIPNPGADSRSYKRFRPTYSLAERFADNRRRGMNRDDAHRYALEGAEQDAVAAQNARSYYAEVTASYEGQEMGVASIGFEVSEWCEEADADEMLDTYDLVGEAVHDAWKALAVAMGVDARLYEEVV